MNDAHVTGVRRRPRRVRVRLSDGDQRAIRAQSNVGAVPRVHVLAIVEALQHAPHVAGAPLVQHDASELAAAVEECGRDAASIVRD